jgi:hypothetical protein
MSRETRLLILTIAVSATVLLLLAQLRFPESPASVVTTAQPLERLAARASYDDLATSVARLEDLIAPSLATLRLEPHVDTAPRRLEDVLVRPGMAADDVRHVPALRIDASTAIAVIDPGTTIRGVVGRERFAEATLIAVDPIRRIARVQVPEGPARTLRQMPLSDLRTPTYIVAVEGTRSGVTLRPVFVGRTDRFASTKWTRELLPLGGALVTPGALVFTLAGDFLGCVVVDEGTFAIAGARDVFDRLEHLTGPPAAPVDPGISVQPLTGALAAVTGAPRGVVVAEVLESGAAAGVLEVGDVILEVEGHPVDSVDRVLLDLGSRLAGGPVTITFTRDRRVHTATLTRSDVEPAPQPWGDAIALEPVRGVGSRVTSVERGTPFDAAGLVAGDVIIRVGSGAAPSPAQVLRAIADTPPGEYLLLAVIRDDRQRVIAVRPVAHSNAGRR